MIRKLICPLGVILAAMLLVPMASADIISCLDFEGGNDPGFGFGFSDGNQVTISNDANSPNGNGSEGLEFAIQSVTGAPGFAGGGFGSFDLGIDPSFVAGNITAAQLCLVSVGFDAEVIGIDPNSFRIEVGGGDFNNRVELGVTPSGGWQNYSISFAGLDQTQKNNLATAMNNANTTEIQFGFSFSQNGDGMFEVGNSVRFDNLKINTVPEPGSALFLSIASLAVTIRRRR